MNPNTKTHSKLSAVAQKKQKKRKASEMPDILESELSKKVCSDAGTTCRTKNPLDTKKTTCMIKTHKQLATYGLKALSIPGLHNLFVLHLFDHNHIELVYFSHSLVITSTTIRDLNK